MLLLKVLSGTLERRCYRITSGGRQLAAYVKSLYTHFLLCLSVFLRLNAGMSVPKEALPACIAAVVTDL